MIQPEFSTSYMENDSSKKYLNSKVSSVSIFDFAKKNITCF